MQRGMGMCRLRAHELLLRYQKTCGTACRLQQVSQHLVHVAWTCTTAHWLSGWCGGPEASLVSASYAVTLPQQPPLASLLLLLLHCAGAGAVGKSGG